MKILTFIFCFFLSVNALAQSGDTIRNDTSKHFMIVDARSITKHDKPLVVIDGTIYNGDLEKINPNDILRVDVLKPPGSTNIYGKQGANGVILITTKRHQNVFTLNKVIELSIIVLLILLIVYYQLKAKWKLVKKISFNKRR